MTDMRERLIELLKYSPSLVLDKGGNWEENADYLIANDVKIERHGVWEYIGKDKKGKVFKCSYCALRIGLDYETTYCPHCGAKMNLEE